MELRRGTKKILYLLIHSVVILCVIATSVAAILVDASTLTGFVLGLTLAGFVLSSWRGWKDFILWRRAERHDNTEFSQAAVEALLDEGDDK